MTLRYALLAILKIEPLSGYDLQKQFSQSVSHVWHAQDSPIYPELRKMEIHGLIYGEAQHRGLRGTRRVYHVTPAGDHAFHTWMASPLKYQRVRDPAHLHAAYLETTTPKLARKFFRNHIQHWQSELEQWQNEIHRIDSLANPMLIRRLAATPESDKKRTVAFKRFTYEGLVERAHAEIDWARRGLDLVDQTSTPYSDEQETKPP